ncbi:MAG: 50S ribosomal protein L24 [Acidimicrobiia bacterium]|nr:50S ribosomal protein L24 [Acidimicrobiia bacterium]
MRLKTGDNVMVITGKDAGKEGRVARVLNKKGKIIVEGVNTAKRHQAPSGQTMQGGIIDKDMPIDASNVMLICETDGPVRSRAEIDADGVKRRVCVKCGADV